MYEPAAYWEQRLSSDLSLASVGHRGFSPAYNRLMYRLKRKKLERALKDHGISVAGKRVVDIGSGTGFFVDFYEANGAKEIAGIDITDASIEWLRARFPRGEFIKGDIGAGSFRPAAPGDIVNAFDVFYHIVDDAAFCRAIVAVCAMCREGGWLLVTDALEPDPGLVEHVRYRPEGEYRAKLEAQGVGIVEIVPVFNRLGVNPWAGMSDGLLKRLLCRVVEAAAPLAYALDMFHCPAKGATMKLLVCRKR